MELIKKYRKSLSVLVIFTVMALFGGVFLQKNIYFWYIWNVFLAVIPLVLSFVLVKIYEDKRSKILIFGVFIAWLLFLPNTFYVLTDFIHISDVSFYFDFKYAQDNTNYILNIRPWFELIITGIAFVISLFCGVISLKKVAGIIEEIKGKIAEILFIGIISLLCGFGIYIGRFLRFNSWDILNPINLLGGIISEVNLFAIEFTLLFAAFIVFSVYFVQSLNDFKKKQKHDKI